MGGAKGKKRREPSVSLSPPFHSLVPTFSLVSIHMDEEREKRRAVENGDERRKGGGEKKKALKTKTTLLRPNHVLLLTAWCADEI